MQSNENMEVTSALQSEQHVKKELAKKLGQLQEKLGELKETSRPFVTGPAASLWMPSTWPKAHWKLLTQRGKRWPGHPPVVTLDQRESRQALCSRPSADKSWSSDGLRRGC